jgi:GNAT superfamily N-acetyltransferase
MRHELSEDSYERIRALFTTPHLPLLADAVIAQNSPARVWVDDPDRPRTAFLWDKGHHYYLAGDAENAAFNAGVTTFVHGQRTQGFSFFEIDYGSPGWEEKIPALFYEISPVKRDRLLYVLRQPTAAGRNAPIPPGFTVQRIDAALLSDSRLTNREAVAGEIGSCWNAIESFLERGFGYVMVAEQELVCWCNAEYVSEGKCDIGIETVRQYQGRGLATCAASAFVEHALARQVTPHWDAWKDNLASLAVARKLGFEELAEYSVFWGCAR